MTLFFSHFPFIPTKKTKFLGHFGPDWNFNLLFDGLLIIQRYLSQLSHKDKVHLEDSDEKWRWIIKEPAFETSKTGLFRVVYHGTAPTIRLRVVVWIIRCHKNLLTVTLPYYHIPYKIQVCTSWYRKLHTYDIQ